MLLYRPVCWREQDPTVQLRAMHIHHGLSANADDWVAHCRQICQQWQVPLLVERVALADEGLGIEAHARQARYQAFRSALLPGEALVTAQHLDDQCETFLLALKRGAAQPGFRRWPASPILPGRNCCVRCLTKAATPAPVGDSPSAQLD